MIQIETTKFTENTLSIRRLLPLSGETITAWNVLVTMLTGRSEMYPTRQMAAGAVLHAYGVQGGYFLSAIGHALQVEFRLTWIRESLVDEPDYADEIEQLFDQFLNHPLLTQDVLKESAWLVRKRLENLAQDPANRAMRMALDAAGKDLAIPMNGVAEETDQVTLEQIRDLYDQLQSAPMQILYAGEAAGNVHAALQRLPQNESPMLTWSALKDREAPQTVLAEREISQSALVQVYSTGILPQDPLYFPLLVLNALLGSSSVSLLFEEIREKRSLCYFIGTSLIRFDGALHVSAGTDRSSMDEVRTQIARIVKETADGRIDPLTLERVKAEMADSMRGQNDYRMAMIEQKWFNTILNRDLDAYSSARKILDVSAGQVAQAASRLRLVSEGIELQKEETADETASDEN